jgi:hypothetical protein
MRVRVTCPPLVIVDVAAVVIAFAIVLETFASVAFAIGDHGCIPGKEVGAPDALVVAVTRVVHPADGVTVALAAARTVAGAALAIILVARRVVKFCRQIVARTGVRVCRTTVGTLQCVPEVLRKAASIIVICAHGCCVSCAKPATTLE